MRNTLAGTTQILFKNIRSMAQKQRVHHCLMRLGIGLLLIGVTSPTVAAPIFSGWSWWVTEAKFGSAEAACKGYPALNYAYDPAVHGSYYNFVEARPNAAYPQYRDCFFELINPSNPSYSETARSRLTVYPYQIDVPSTGCPAGSNYCKQSGPTCPATPDPIAIGTGNKFLVETDLSAIVFQRYFNAVNTDTAASAVIAAGTMPMGLGWTFGYGQRIRVPLGAATVAWAIRPNGRIYTYQAAGGGWTSDADVSDQLIELKDGSGVRTGWRYVDAGSQKTEVYDANGFLQSVANASGMQTTLIYSDGTDGTISGRGGFVLNANGAPILQQILPAGLLLRAQDDFGRVLQLGYDKNTRIVMLAYQGISASDIIRYAYDSAGRLTKVTYQDGTAKTYLYGEAAYTSGANLPSALTGILDEHGTRVISYTYAANGKAIREMRAGGVGGHQLTYTLDAAGNVVNTAVTDATGSIRSYGFIKQLGVSRPTGVSQPAGSGCAASASAQSHDANGNVAQRDDFNGKRVCYASDPSRTLETMRVEGVANTTACSTVTPSGSSLPAGSRKTSTQWHPDWRLRTRLAEPGRITSYVYNGQPDPFNGNAVASCAPSTATLPDGKPIAVPCKKVEQATTDANGSQGFAATMQAGVANRVWQWTYNDKGQVLTERDPLNNQTTNDYYASTTADYTLGDLQRSTNAAGHVIQYPRYNKHGQVLEMIDANGVVSDYTYDLRQRLKTATTAGQTTSYDYDAAGQLRRVTSPDASYIAYDYDAAHRLVAVSDSRGNRIDYTLDNAGNRTAEQVRDPNGALKHQLARAIDALGRIQQTTGRE